MHLVRGARLCRLLSLLSLGAMLLLVAETAFADVHDGDVGVQASSVATAAPAPGGAGSQVGAPPALPASDTPPADHGPHVCHCAHAHVGWAPRPMVPSTSSITVLITIAGPDEHRLDGVRMPVLRPPIA